MREANGDFNQIIEESKTPVVVDFWAPWCSPCRAMAPVLEKVEEQFGDKVKFLKVDVDKSPKAVNQFGIRSIPSLLLFTNRTPKKQLVGMQKKSDIVSMIRAAIK